MSQLDLKVTSPVITVVMMMKIIVVTTTTTTTTMMMMHIYWHIKMSQLDAVSKSHAPASWITK